MHDRLTGASQDGVTPVIPLARWAYVVQKMVFDRASPLHGILFVQVTILRPHGGLTPNVSSLTWFWELPPCISVLLIPNQSAWIEALLVK
ncbi:hypothetical protein ACJ73_05487 [Blastomyces percursus]|uniref:Uncharacterized protein n=1 Tax=Blastomyces percursus TaxID=1658174 RepID=A0A1J9Q4Y0_9EURO|nr:hypothetical protein ACJ73_05487 [Blastomyces percursus]